ncbi:hypothetical protein JD292_02060 [Leucobacter sp. CSA2]|uniref:Uncharacterized protein n=1 Tax=Leucobacter edaphi TaxID=2796472 RepID=A0A934QCX1_9MICO|nr:hypothetical protein [Leucobacter edaphi]MBK0420864.1 hypothetical protein [Leucobacter edaphi]
MTRRIIVWAIGILIAALYGYMVVAAIGNFLLLPQMAASLGVALTPVGWGWLTFGIALPVVVFAVALVFARKRSAWVRILLLATGLCFAAAVQLEVLHMVPQTSYFSA